MLKFESVANVGDIIKAFDFQPMPSREDVYLIGKVIAKGHVGGLLGYDAYTVEVITSDAWSNREVGEIAYVPFESTFDFDGRVVLA